MIEAIDQLYVHLPQKKSATAYDPVQGLRLLQHRIRQVEGLALDEFYGLIQSVLGRLGDYHLQLRWDCGQVNWLELPLRLERAGDEVLVAAVARSAPRSGSGVPLQVGMKVTHWCGQPILSAIYDAAEKLGASPGLALETMTRRELGVSPAPSHDWVELRTSQDDRFHLDWVRSSAPTELVDGVQLRTSRQQALMEMARPAQPEPDSFEEPLRGNPGTESFYIGKLRGAAVGYLRLYSFPAGRSSNELFWRDWLDALTWFEKGIGVESLIIDVRDNEGGSVRLAEKLVQTFSNGKITPTPFQVRATPLALRVFAPLETYEAWTESLDRQALTGETFSVPRPLSSVRDINDTGQIFSGSVVIVADDRSLSAAEIFTALAQDHDAATVVLTTARTGGAGATMDRLPVASQWPASGSLLLPLRRALRQGLRAGELLEDLGVRPGHSKHYLPLEAEDLVCNNRRLLARLVVLLAKEIRPHLDRARSSRPAASVWTDACEAIAGWPAK